jgi:hypothetical protein
MKNENEDENGGDNSNDKEGIEEFIVDTTKKKMVKELSIINYESTSVCCKYLRFIYFF